MQVNLSEPFTAADKTKQSFVNMRTKVTVGDWRLARRQGGEDHEERMFALVCSMCGLTPQEVEQFGLGDFNMLVEKLDFGSDPKEPSAD